DPPPPAYPADEVVALEPEGPRPVRQAAELIADHFFGGGFHRASSSVSMVWYGPGLAEPYAGPYAEPGERAAASRVCASLRCRLTVPSLQPSASAISATGRSS